MPRFKLTIQYDGTNFFGWQSQKSERTVQGTLEARLAPLNQNKRVKVIGAGRTDTGVHAWGQVAHFDLQTDLKVSTIKRALNATLPVDISVTDLIIVPDDFHARYRATKRYYRYQCCRDNNLLFRNQAWLVNQADVSFLHETSSMIMGEHDFKSFARVNPEMENYKCTVYQSQWSQSQNMLIYHIAANRFLHHMVCYITGSMIAVAGGKFSVNEFKGLLTNPQKDVKIFKAPPQGLILERVDYE